MLIPFSTIVQKYPDPKITGILHVGGHLAEEFEAYRQEGITNVIWVEADADRSNQIGDITGQTCYTAVVSDKDGELVTFHEANNGQSSSILELGTHLTAHPEVHYVREVKCFTTTLATALDEMQPEGLNFLNLDIQGAELKALQGLGSYLSDFDYIYAEVNREELYLGGAFIGQIDEFLEDFDRVDTVWTQFGWGDALFVRKQ